MSGYTQVDLSKLPFPGVVESLSYETILSEMLTDLRVRDARFSALVESDPAYKILEVAAYRELLLRQRVNDAAKACLLAYSGGADLDHLCALFGVQRLEVDPGDPDATPPVPPTYEADGQLRTRGQMALEGFSTAGPVGAYEFHALSASGQVRSVSVYSPVPGDISVVVLSAEGDGTPDQDLLDTVSDAVNAEEVRPLSDSVTVQAAEIVEYQVSATLKLYQGPDSGVVQAAAVAALTAYTDSCRRIGRDIALSGLYGALHRSGVHEVILGSPAGTILVDRDQAAYCTAITVTVEGTDE